MWGIVWDRLFGLCGAFRFTEVVVAFSGLDQEYELHSFARDLR